MQIKHIIGCKPFDHNVSSNSITLKSPEYPNEYKGGHDCYGVVRVNQGEKISITFLDFDVEKDIFDNSWYILSKIVS